MAEQPETPKPNPPAQPTNTATPTTPEAARPTGYSDQQEQAGATERKVEPVTPLTDSDPKTNAIDEAKRKDMDPRDDMTPG